MLITLKDGYVYSFALVGEVDGGITVDEPEDINHFLSNSESYKLIDDKLIFDEEKDKQLSEERELEELRRRREKECFSVINRGQAWYNSLTPEQAQELQSWYYA